VPWELVEGTGTPLMRNAYRPFATKLDPLRETKDLLGSPLPVKLPNLKKDPKISNFKIRLPRKR
jgi:hypothetical protein